MDFEELKRLLSSQLTSAHVEVEDLTGTGDHLGITVVSPDFARLPLLAQHRKVMEILQGPLKGELHAVKIKTFTPEKFRDVTGPPT